VEFPDEKAGINRYFQLMAASSNMIYIHHILKVTCYFQSFSSSDYEKTVPLLGRNVNHRTFHKQAD
jgi:hypothetical protein